jgi:hypothetical protein
MEALLSGDLAGAPRRAMVLAATGSDGAQSMHAPLSLGRARGRARSDEDEDDEPTVKPEE